MSGLFSFSYQRWKTHPRRYDIPFLLSSPMRRFWIRSRAESQRRKLLVPPIDTVNMEILADEEFQASAAAASTHTLLDVGRLANLWYLARQAGDGIYLEIGSYRGGGALHICNAIQGKQSLPLFYSIDPFEDGGFTSVSDTDNLFHKDQFLDTSFQNVVTLLAHHQNAKVVKGFFPQAVQNLNLDCIAFCHLDVDVYEATRDSLEFLSTRLARRSFIVLDDVNRNVRGVEKALQEFLANHPEFLLIPLFPSQGLLLSTKLWP